MQARIFGMNNIGFIIPAPAVLKTAGVLYSGSFPLSTASTKYEIFYAGKYQHQLTAKA